MKDWILRINLLVFIVLTVCYLYQVVYVAVVLFKRNKQKATAALHPFTGTAC